MRTRRLMGRRNRSAILRHQQFSRALAWAEDQQLIGVEEIDGRHVPAADPSRRGAGRR